MAETNTAVMPDLDFRRAALLITQCFRNEFADTANI
jgi:hypothetical protein